MDGSSPCNTEVIFTVCDNSLSFVMALFFRYAFLLQVYHADPRRMGLFTHELTKLSLLIFHRFAYHSQHPQGSWVVRCLVFPRQYRAVVHWIGGPTSVSETHQITLLSLLFELSSGERLTCPLLLVRDVARHGVSTP